MTTTSRPPLFEHEICSRCNGSGRYSFNMMHGDRCYGCSGTGYRLTKRGQAAQAYLNSLRTKPASEVQVGDIIKFEFGSKAAYLAVEEIEIDTLNGGGRFTLWATRRNGERVGEGCVPASTVELWVSEIDRVAQRRAALAYQASLTKAGVPSKRWA